MSSGLPYEEHFGVPRLIGEPGHQWNFRRIFIDVNKKFYTGDRLAAYSLAWSNWKFLGSTYGIQVQNILKTCHRRLPMEVGCAIKALQEAGLTKVGLAKVDFVKSAALQSIDSEGQPAADTSDSLKYLHASKDDLGTSSSSSPSNSNVLNNKKSVRTQRIDFVQAINVEAKEKDLIISQDQEVTNDQSGMDQESDLSCSQKNEKTQKNKKIYNSYPKLDGNNLGHSMLCKLGWKGSGGIGKHEDGISEPVFLRPTKGRKGLGLEHERKIKVPKLSSDVLVPGLTLYLSSFEKENPVISLFESCVRSNVLLAFRSIDKNKDHGLEVLLQNKVIATGYGKNAKKSRINGAKKALDILRDSQMIIFKSEAEKRLCSNEVIPGLTIYCRQVIDEDPVEVINESCAKCELPVDWWDDSGQCISGTIWTVMLLINSKRISVGRGNTKDKALKKCATKGLKILKGSHAVIGFDSSFMQEKGPPITETSTNLKTGDTYVVNSFEEDELASGLLTADGNTSLKKDGIAKPIVVNAIKGVGVDSLSISPQPKISSVCELTIYLAYHGEEKVGSPHKIIKHSCDKCKMSFKIEGTWQGKSAYSARLMINDSVVATGCAKKVNEAKQNACTRGLDCLLRTQPIIYENRVFCRKFLDNSQLLMGEPSRAEEAPGKELIPGLTLHLPYRGEDDAYPNPGNIIEESCSACNCSNDLRINNQMTSDRSFSYELFIENKLVSVGSGVCPKEAKNNAYSNGLELLLGKQPIIYSSEVGHTPLQKGEIIPGLILYLLSPEDTSFVSVNAMTKSCRECGMSLEFPKYGKKVCHQLKKVIWCVMLVINDKEIAKGYGISINNARHDAAGNAIQVLIQNKQPVVYESEIYIDVAEDHAKLREVHVKGKGGNLDNNKPGWSQSKKQVSKILLDFVESGESAIRFSVDLSNKDRALVHRTSEELGLKHMSYGLDGARYIVISKLDTSV